MAELIPLWEIRSSILAGAFLAEAARPGVPPPKLAPTVPPFQPVPVVTFDECLADWDKSGYGR